MMAAIPDWLLPGDIQGEITAWTWRAHPMFGWVGTAVVVSVLIGLAFVLYRSRMAELPLRRRGLLIVLRTLALCCLVPAMVELSLNLQVLREVQPVLGLAIDTSESMTLPDRINGGIPVTRLEGAKRLLLNSRDDVLNRLANVCRVLPFRFDRSATPLTEQNISAAVSALTADGQQTSLADSIDAMAQHMRGQPAAGVVLLTDGVSNIGGSPIAACERWEQAHLPIHTVAFGEANPKDIQVSQVLVDQMLFADDPANVVVRVRQRGYAGRTIPVILHSGTEELARQEVQFKEDQGESNVTLTFTPKQAGEFTYRVECPVQPGEAVTPNNVHHFAARVTRDQIRVLYLEQRPRWQYRFLCDAMTRDRRLKPQILLSGGERVADLPPPFIQQLPETEEAFRELDLVILGDIPPTVFTADQMQWIRNWVRDEGGSLLVQGGPVFTPQAYADTPLADLLPVEVASKVTGEPGRPRARESDRFVPELTPLGQTHPALQLGDSLEQSMQQWRQLVGIYWHAPIQKIRGGAAVLAVHPRESVETAEDQSTPLLAVQHFGRGKCFYAGIDETWRWRIKQGDRIFYRLWGQIIQYLGAPHLAGEQRVTLQTDKPIYNSGESALITVRVEDLQQDEHPVVISENELGDQQRMTLQPATGAEFLYESKLPLVTAGLYRLWVDGLAIDASCVIEVTAPQLELQEPAAGIGTLRQMAELTGGQFAQSDDFLALIDRLDFSPRKIREEYELVLWDRPWAAALFVLFIGIEWALRRLWQLS